MASSSTRVRSVIPFLILGLLGAAFAAPGGDPERLLRAIRSRYHGDDFPRVGSIRFTAREERPGSEDIRHWEWFPGPDSVFYRGPDRKGMEVQAGYSRKNKWSLGSETIAGIDSLFRRDRIAFLFPQLLGTGDAIRWGEGAGETKGRSGKDAEWVRIEYASGGKPSAYAILADSDGVIRAWTVPGAGPESAGTRYEWSPPRKVDGLPLSLERKGPRGYSIRFSDVKMAWLKR